MRWRSRGHERGEFVAQSHCAQSHAGHRCQTRRQIPEVLPTDMRIKVPKALPYRYADLVVVCGEPVIEDMQGLEVLVNPLIIFEVYLLQPRRMIGA